MIRRAETKDLLIVSDMMKRCIEFHQKLGVDIFSQDPGVLLTGVLEHVILTINDPDGLILLNDEAKGIEGMVAGSLRKYPNYHEHRLVGEIFALYPASFPTSPLLDEFDKWARQRGATARTSFTVCGNDAMIKAQTRNGSKAVLQWFVKPFDKDA